MEDIRNTLRNTPAAPGLTFWRVAKVKKVQLVVGEVLNESSHGVDDLRPTGSIMMC